MTPDRSSVTVVGLGSMGSALARAFGAAGCRVTVWNRTPERATALAGQARVAESVVDACSASDVVVVSLLDYEASDSLLHVPEVERALGGRVLVQLSTGTPAAAREAEAWADRHGVSYLDGAIMGYPRVIGTDQAVILYSGPEDVFEDNRELLALLGVPMHCGEAIGGAPTLDLALVEVLFTTWAAILHGAALCAAEGYPQAGYFAALPAWLGAIGSIIQETETMVVKGAFTGGNSTMAVNTRAAGHILEASRQAGVDTSLPATLVRLCQSTVAAGLGEADFPSVYVALSGPAGSPHSEA